MYALMSVIIVSLISFVGAVAIMLTTERLRSLLLVLVGFGTGAMLGDVFLHLIPEVVEDRGFPIEVSLLVLGGIVFFFVLEKFVHWHHGHHPAEDEGLHHVHSSAVMNLVGEILHNFIDGLIIGASYLVSVPVGIATTIAVVLHEIPQEIGDFGILVHGGYSKAKALLLNFLVTIFAVAGTVLALFLGGVSDRFTNALVPFAIGAFVYIAGSDLIPELHKDVRAKHSVFQLFAFLVGIGIMGMLLLLE